MAAEPVPRLGQPLVEGNARPPAGKILGRRSGADQLEDLTGLGALPLLRFDHRQAAPGQSRDPFHQLPHGNTGPGGKVRDPADAVRAVSEGKAFFSPKVSRMLADDYTRFLEREHVADSYDLLTGRERQILQLLAEGQTNKDVATILNLSPTTVLCHRQHIFQKLNLHNVSDLILYAIRKGVISSHIDRTTG